ncbi:MAG: DUF882 domain-containing protein [Pseudomonadota bacterium]
MAMLVCLAAAGPAMAETRTLKIHFTHTKERASITFKRNGRYIPSGLKELNTILRDWRQKESTKMDPRLFDLLWEVYQASGSREYIHVVSAYRSPKTNAMLRKRSRGVAKNSQHTLGKAIDFFLPDVPVKKVRRIGMQFQVGGVGYYPKSGSPFVHLDVGSVRSWPRMSRKELSSVFPSGKTLHLPTDGKPLPGYNQALADYKSRVSAKSIQVAGKRPARRNNNTRDEDDGNRSTGGGGNLLAGLFNRNQDSDQSNNRGRVVESDRGQNRIETQATQVAAIPTRQPPADVEATPEPSAPELAYVPTPQTRPSPPDDVAAQIALAAATTGPLPVSQATLNAGGVSTNAQDGGPLTVSTLINTYSAANPVPAAQIRTAASQAIPVPKIRAGSSDEKGTRIALARAQDNPPPEVVLGSLLNASAMADPADTPLAREQWGNSEGGADAKNSRLGSKVPRPGLRPDVGAPDAQVITASLGTGRTGRVTGADGIPVPTRSPLAYTETPLQVALAPASGGVDSTDGGHGFGSFLNSASVPRLKGARPTAVDAANVRRSSLRTEPYVTEHMIGNRALTNVTMTSMSAAVTAPQFVSSYLRQAPNMVHVDGFSQEHGINSADQFSGQAVNFMSVTRFNASN